jgi:hypothetical protein
MWGKCSLSIVSPASPMSGINLGTAVVRPTSYSCEPFTFGGLDNGAFNAGSILPSEGGFGPQLTQLVIPETDHRTIGTDGAGVEFSRRNIDQDLLPKVDGFMT